MTNYLSVHLCNKLEFKTVLFTQSSLPRLTDEYDHMFFSNANLVIR